MNSFDISHFFRRMEESHLLCMEQDTMCTTMRLLVLQIHKRGLSANVMLYPSLSPYHSPSKSWIPSGKPFRFLLGAFQAVRPETIENYGSRKFHEALCHVTWGGGVGEQRSREIDAGRWMQSLRSCKGASLCRLLR